MSNHYTPNHYTSNHYASNHYAPNHYVIGPTLALLLAVTACAGKIPVHAHQAQNFSGKVVEVSDGDTVTVLRDGEKVKVRLAGIDCPEKKQPFGEQAKEFTEKLCLGKKVQVKIAEKGTDRHGRILGEVILSDGKILNEELLRAGLAWWYEHFAPHNTAYAELEKEAREAGRGLWPTPPWEFRKRRSAARDQGPAARD